MQEAPNATFSKAEAASVFARIGRLACLSLGRQVNAMHV
jgi:hypothetical protein